MLRIIQHAPPSALQWEMVIEGMRNSWESWEKGDSEARYDIDGDWFDFGPADKALAMRLTRAGADHGKYLRQLPVVIDIEAPEYWWREFDQYKIGVVTNSTSQMHTLGKHPFAAAMFSFEDVPDVARITILHTLNVLRDRWIDAGRRKGPDAVEWRAMAQAIPDSWNYRRLVTLNYQVLRAMYHARKAHRLREWRDFCAWIETLPHSDLIIAE